MRAIIIDDDKAVAKSISRYLDNCFPEIIVCDIVGDIEAGYRAIQEIDPQLVFLDIHLTDGTAFDLLKKFGKVEFKIIFITGHEEHAIKAFKYSAIDYILKPIDFDELSDAINRAKQASFHNEEHLKASTFIENYETRSRIKRIILRTAEFMHIVKIEDIIRCEADNNYTFFHLNYGNQILVSKTIKEYAVLLHDVGFIRVHQSHLINPDYIDKYVKSDGGYLLMKDGSEIPISLRNKDLVIRTLDSLLYS